MTDDTLKLTDREVLEYARDNLQEHLSLQAEGYRCTTTDLLDVLLGVAASRDTIESVCADWIDTASAETVRGYLNEQLTIEVTVRTLVKEAGKHCGSQRISACISYANRRDKSAPPQFK